jgi:dienelactone hydrolase
MISSKRSILRRVLLVTQIILLLPIAWFLYHLLMPRHFISKTAEKLPLTLSSGPFETLYYAADHPKGILIVATGDGGWSNQWEEPVALHAAAAGYAVGGWDCRKFADTRRFDQAQLLESFNAAVAAVRQRAALPSACPVWFTGWSTGAEWALAAAASPDREPHLLGILPVSPGDRSRYGISPSDLLGAQPTGPDTYALKDLAPQLHGLRIVQFAGEIDVLDDTEWLKSLHAATPHKLIEIPGATHDMDGAGDRFMAEFDMAIQWISDTAIP